MYSISSRARWHEDLKQCDEQQQQQHDHTKQYKPPTPGTDSLLGGWGWCGRGPMVEQVFEISCVEELTIFATKQKWKCAQVVIAVRQKRLLFHHLWHRCVCVFEGAAIGLCVVQFSQVFLNPMKTRGVSVTLWPCHLH
jgi:hypothetical protein